MVQTKEDLLEELMEIVDHVDRARGAHSHMSCGFDTGSNVNYVPCMMLKYCKRSQSPTLVLTTFSEGKPHNASQTCVQTLQFDENHNSEGCVAVVCLPVSFTDLKVIGGFQTVVDLMKSKHDGLRSRAAELVSVVVQNNLVVQEWALGFGVMPVLVNLLKDKEPTVVVKVHFLGELPL